MAINERVITGTQAAAAADGGTGNQEDGLIIYVDANDVDSTDGDNDTTWYDITDHEYTPATDVSEHFNTVIYTGSGDTTNGQSITGVGFQPDLVWIKSTGTTYNHVLYDSLRGVNSAISSNLTDDAWANENRFESFDSDGFSIEADNAADLWKIDRDGEPYVAWCFKAGGAPSGSDKVSIDGTSYATMTAAGLTDGSVSINKLSVNTKLGFSIATYNGNNSTGTVAHGLGQKPQFIIIKNIDSDNTSWIIFHDDISATKYLQFTGAGATTASNRFNNTEPTSTVWSFGTSDNVHTTDEHVVYSFTSKRGVSEIGSYEGNGGEVTVKTGFEPAFVLSKNVTASSGDWVIHDNVRGGNKYLYPYLNYAEGTSNDYDVTFHRDGFTIDGYTTNNHKHIYVAFAKNTNETSLIDDTDLVVHLDAGDDNSYSGSGSTWNDLANSNDATITGASYDEELGDFFSFDGTDDELTFSSSTALTTRTIEFWYYSDDLNNNYWIFDSMPQYASTNSFGVWSIYIDSSHIYFIGAAWNGSTYGGYQGNNPMQQDKWYHITFSCENGSYKGYIDGELIADNNNSAYVTTRNIDSVTLSNVNFMGTRSGYTGGTYYAEGKIGQIRIYDSVLSQSQIRQNFNFTKNDYPNGFNFTKYGATFDTSTHSNPDVDAYSLDGSNDYFDNTTFGRNLGTIDYTLSAWIYVQGALSGSGGYVIMGNYGGSKGMWLDVIKATGKLRLYHTGGTAVNQQSTGTVSQNTWHHVICVRDRGQDKVNFFIDGVAAGSFTIAEANGSDDKTGFEIGRYNSGYYFNGDIAQVKVYDKALSTTECQALFNQNATTFGKTEV
jgi:hypothetical protein